MLMACVQMGGLNVHKRRKVTSCSFISALILIEWPKIHVAGIRNLIINICLYNKLLLYTPLYVCVSDLNCM